MNGLKQAALKISTLVKADRKWLLRQLPVEQAQRIKQYLRQLRHLDPSCRRTLNADLVNDLLQVSNNTDEVNTTFVEDYHLIVEHLQSQPVAITAVVIAAQSWPWLVYFQRCCDPQYWLQVSEFRSRQLVAIKSHTRQVIVEIWMKQFKHQHKTVNVSAFEALLAQEETANG